MSKEPSPNCPQCGAPLPDNAPAGLCPNCLMALNLKTETVFTDAPTTAQPPLPPEQIAPHFPQLEILECLGRGGMGVVYQARQKTLNRLVALKLLAPERVNDPRFAERFTREAQALAALNHPHIVTIYDFGQAGGFYFLLMEFVDGANLRQLMRARKFAPEEALAIVPVICDALQFAHNHGIVHRDIKPENILLNKEGKVKIADFGIAKMLGNGDTASPSNSPENATHSALGTPGYHAPEQKTNPQQTDNRADIYSLGVVFYEMLTGELPAKRIEPPSKKVHIDVRLDAVVLRALEKTPELRWQTAEELRTEIETIAATSSRSRGDEAQTENQSWPKSIAINRTPRFLRAAAIVGMVIIGILAFMLARHRITTPNAVTLTQSDFLQKFDSNQVINAVMTVNSPASGGAISISGKFIKTGPDGKVLMEDGKPAEELFVAPNILLTPTITDKLVTSPVIKLEIPNPMLSDIFYQLLFFVLFGMSVLLVLGIIIYVVWRAMKKPVDPSAPPVQKPDHFWRRFAVVVLALISIPFLIALLGLFAAIAIPAFVKARQHALALREQQTTIKSDYIGESWFPNGDSIEITSVHRTKDELVVQGHYTLASEDDADLSLNITTTNRGWTETDPRQTLKISQGSGDFELIHPNLAENPGWPHVSMYSTNGHSFAGIYFGTQKEADEESARDIGGFRLRTELPSSPAVIDSQPNALGSPIELKLKWPPGKRYLLDFNFKQDTAILLRGRADTVNEDVTIGNQLGLTVLQETPGGGHELALEFLSARMGIKMGDHTILDYDSANESAMDPTNGVAAVFGKIVGSNIRYFLNAANDPVQLEGVTDLVQQIQSVPQTDPLTTDLKNIFNAAYFEAFTNTSPFLPHQAVQPGDTWPSHLEHPVAGVGIEVWDFNIVFQNWETHDHHKCARLDLQGIMKVKPDPNSKRDETTYHPRDGVAEGVAWFDPELGQAVETDMKQDLNVDKKPSPNPDGTPNGAEPGQTITTQRHQVYTIKLKM